MHVRELYIVSHLKTKQLETIIWNMKHLLPSKSQFQYIRSEYNMKYAINNKN